jgi:hypothetical protein
MEKRGQEEERDVEAPRCLPKAGRQPPLPPGLVAPTEMAGHSSRWLEVEDNLTSGSHM